MSDWRRNAGSGGGDCNCCPSGDCGKFTPFIETGAPGNNFCWCNAAASWCTEACGQHPYGLATHCGDKLRVSCSGGSVGGVAINGHIVDLPSNWWCPSIKDWYSVGCVTGQCNSYSGWCPPYTTAGHGVIGGNPSNTVFSVTSTCTNPACNSTDCNPCLQGACCYEDGNNQILCVDNVDAANCTGNYLNGVSHLESSCAEVGCSNLISSCGEACCVDFGWPWGTVPCTNELTIACGGVWPDVDRTCTDADCPDCTHCYAHSFVVVVSTQPVWQGIDFSASGWAYRVDMPCGTRCLNTEGATITMISCDEYCQWDVCDPEPGQTTCCNCDTCNPVDEGDPVCWCECGLLSNCYVGCCPPEEPCCGNQPSFAITQYHSDNPPTVGACCCVEGNEGSCLDGLTAEECSNQHNGIWQGEGSVCLGGCTGGCGP